MTLRFAQYSSMLSTQALQLPELAWITATHLDSNRTALMRVSRLFYAVTAPLVWKRITTLRDFLNLVHSMYITERLSNEVSTV